MSFARPKWFSSSRLRCLRSQIYIRLDPIDRLPMGKPERQTMTKRSVMKVSKSSAEAFAVGGGGGAKATGVANKHRKEAMAGLKVLKAPKAQPVAKSTPCSIILVKSIRIE